jgi:hypothetical protein
MTKALTREERLGLLTAASAEELIDAADACLAAASSFAVVTPPSVGCVPAQVREPVRRQRFFLGDVLACTAEVEFDGVRGWAMRLGDDRAAALAMAGARLVAALRPLAFGELAGLRTGTAAAPEDGALACLAVSGIAIVDGADWAEAAGVVEAIKATGVAGVTEAAEPAEAVGVEGESGDGGREGGGRVWLRLAGPGVPGTRAIIVTGLPPGFVEGRRRLVAGFPAGADLLLIAPDGAMAGLPRTTDVHEGAA